MGEHFHFQLCNPPVWSEIDQKLYPYRLKTEGGWTEPTALKGHMCLFPEGAPWLSLLPNGELWMKSGYLWDGPSGVAIDTPTFMRASLVHDALYQLIKQGLLPKSARKKADAEMRRICREDGMGWFRSWYAWAAVRVFGGVWMRFSL